MAKVLILNSLMKDTFNKDKEIFFEMKLMKIDQKNQLGAIDYNVL